METFTIDSQDKLHVIAAKILSLASLQATNEKSVVVAFEGDLGSGKTALCKAIATELGIVETVTSPTFVVMKVYDIDAVITQPFKQLYHIDAYRIEDIDEMRPLRFSEVLAHPFALVCIEWAEHIAPLLPQDTIYVHLTHVHNTEERIITIR